MHCTSISLPLSTQVIVLYKCICPRNYAEWRAGWAGDRAGSAGQTGGSGGSGAADIYSQVVQESVPIVCSGLHRHEVKIILSLS